MAEIRIVFVGASEESESDAAREESINEISELRRTIVEMFKLLSRTDSPNMPQPVQQNAWDFTKELRARLTCESVRFFKMDSEPVQHVFGSLQEMHDLLEETEDLNSIKHELKSHIERALSWANASEEKP